MVWWLWEETHVPKVVGSNQGTVYWMDISSHIFFVVKNVMMFVLKKTENKRYKRPGYKKMEAHNTK